MEYRPEVDGLRAVAVLAVVAYHAGLPGLPGGFVGVDVFFVISGFLITGLLCEEFEKSGHFSWAGFLERRVRRLAPALLLVIATTLALGLFYLSPIGGEQQGLARSALASLALSANFYFMAFTGDYFDAPAEAQPLVHLWSLAVEEQFYLVWPWLLWAAYLAVRQRRLQVSIQTAQLSLFLMVLVVSLVACIALTPASNQAAFYLSPMRAWEFAAGALVFWWLRYKPEARPITGRSLAIVGLALIMWAGLCLDSSMSFPGYWAVVPVLGAALVIAGNGVDPTGPVAWLLRRPVIVWLGLISYPLYLWHWPLLVLGRSNSLEPLPPPNTMLLVALAVLLSWGTWRFVELPVRGRRWPWVAPSRQLFRSAGMGMASVACMAIIMGVWSKWIWPKQESNAELAAAVNGLQKVRIPCAQSVPYTAGQLVPASSCGVTKPNDEDRKIVLVWGDSHAAHLVPALARLAEESNLSLRVRYMPECPPLLGFDPSDAGITRPRGCQQFNADVLAEITQLQVEERLAGVYLNARWAGYTRFGADLQGARSGLKASLHALQAVGAKATLLAPGPEFPSDVPRCLVRRSATSCDLPRDKAETARANLLQMMSSNASEFGATLIDPFKALCTASTCPAMTEGELLYSDSHHWTVPGSLAVLAALKGTS